MVVVVVESIIVVVVVIIVVVVLVIVAKVIHRVSLPELIILERDGCISQTQSAFFVKVCAFLSVDPSQADNLRYVREDLPPFHGQGAAIVGKSFHQGHTWQKRAAQHRRQLCEVTHDHQTKDPNSCQRSLGESEVVWHRWFKVAAPQNSRHLLETPAHNCKLLGSDGRNFIDDDESDIL